MPYNRVRLIDVHADYDANVPAPAILCDIWIRRIFDLEDKYCMRFKHALLCIFCGFQSISMSCTVSATDLKPMVGNDVFIEKSDTVQERMFGMNLRYSTAVVGTHHTNMMASTWMAYFVGLAIRNLLSHLMYTFEYLDFTTACSNVEKEGFLSSRCRSR